MNDPLLNFEIFCMSDWVSIKCRLNVSSPDFAGDEASNSCDQVQELPCYKYLNESLRSDNGDKTQQDYYLSLIFHLRKDLSHADLPGNLSSRKLYYLNRWTVC